jgi:putative redox protein
MPGTRPAWAARYLPGSAGRDRGPAPARDGRHEVVVTESDARPYGQRITAGGHHLTADEPADFGGADSGPGPYDLLLTALGACTAVTVRIYAERKGWGLRHITVRLRHERVHAAACAGCETRTSLLDHIQRELTFDGDLSDEQRSRLLAIAEHCPAHRTLRAGILVSTTERT